MDGWGYLQKVDYEQLSFKCRKCREYGHFVKSFPIEATKDPGKTQKEGWQQVKRGNRVSYNSHNDNNDFQTEKTKENATTSKEMNINDPYMALHIEEGEIPAVVSTPEGE